MQFSVLRAATWPLLSIIGRAMRLTSSKVMSATRRLIRRLASAKSDRSQLASVVAPNAPCRDR